MDEWNRFPMNDSEQPQTPTEPAEPAPAPPEPAAEPETTPTVPYASYGWQQVPYTPPPKKKRGNGVLAAISVISVAVIVVLSVLLAMMYRGDLPTGTTATTNNVTSPTRNENAPTVEIIEPDEDLEGLTTREIVKRNLNSTVLLKMYTTGGTVSGLPFGQSGTEQETQAGSASGIVMSADGYIITNGHCVINENTNKPFARIEVILYDGTVYENAEVIGADTTTDLAVIKVNATGLQPAQFGDSTTVQLGDRVVALGNAGGLGFSATQGILSGLARDVYEDTGYAIKCFQVDAAINPGNSGGPLFNAAGQVIAVNSAKIVASGYEGLGFAIPINEAKQIVDDLTKNGYVTGRVSLGITGQTYADAYYEGFLIRTIEEGSPLRQTDARKGDLIVAVGDTKVTDYASLRSALAQHKVGDTITLTLLRATNRNVESYEVSVKLTEAKQ